jgi:hypothetical protein
MSSPFRSAVVIEFASEQRAAAALTAGQGESALGRASWYRTREDGAPIAIREYDSADTVEIEPNDEAIAAMQIAFAGDPSSRAFEAAFVFALSFCVPVEEIRGFDTWYDSEHVPMLLECHDWLTARRFRIEGGHRYNRLVLHYLASEEALQSRARARSQETPARKAIALRPWFNQGQRLVLRKQ